MINPIQTAAQLITTLPFLSSAADVVGVYLSDFTQVFRNARPMKASVKPNSKLMEHPLDDGSTIIDHRVILPTEIELYLFLGGFEGRNTYSEILSLWNNAQLLTVQTKTSSYPNMLIESPPYDEDPELFDSIIVTLKLRQAQFYTATTGQLQPLNPVNNDTSDRGTIQPGTPTAEQTTRSSTLFDLFAHKI